MFVSTVVFTLVPVTDAIIELYQSKEVDHCLRTNFPYDWQDVKQDLFERLLTQPNDNIQNLKFYIIRAIINLKRQPYGKQAKQYKGFAALTENIESIAEQYSEDEFHQQLEKVNQLDWYYKGLMELYVKLGTAKAVADATQIPYWSVVRTIKHVRQICRQES